jgi:hypothetical protein
MRRHRRPLAAISAGLSVLFIISALRPDPPAPITVQSVTDIQPNEVGIPVAMANPALITTIQVGDIVDVLALNTPIPQRVTQHARVLATSDGGVLLLAVSSADANAVSGLTVDVPLTVQLHPPRLP